jgi:diguanylate cyclase (GGDEF)-like protein
MHMFLEHISAKTTPMLQAIVSMTAQRDPEQLLTSFCRIVQEMTQAMCVALGAFDEDGRTLRHFLSNGIESDITHRGSMLVQTEPLVTKLLQERQSLRLGHLDSKRLSVGDALLAPGGSPVRSILGVPICSSGTAYGWLVLIDKIGGDEFTSEDEQLSAMMAAQVGLAYENLLLGEKGQRDEICLQQERRERLKIEKSLCVANAQLARSQRDAELRTQEITLLSELGSLLHCCVVAREAYSIIASLAGKLFPSQRGAVYALNDSRNLLEAVALWGDSPVTESVFKPTDCWAVRTGRPHLANEDNSAIRCAHVNQVQPSSSMCVPMMAQGEPLGFLYLESQRGTARRGSASSWQRLAVTVAQHIGLALANLKLQETLRGQSIRDPLTGLFNRRYMEESLEREFRRAVRNQRPLSAVMIDIDHFKRLNDEHGHEAGDEVLGQVGKLLGASVRKEDIVCRYGGEEFMLIMPEASLPNAAKRAEQLREKLKHLPVHFRGRNLGPVTISAGVAAFPEHGSCSAEVLRRADESLYRAKAAGRDQVVIASRLTEPSHS